MPICHCILNGKYTSFNIGSLKVSAWRKSVNESLTQEFYVSIMGAIKPVSLKPCYLKIPNRWDTGVTYIPNRVPIYGWFLLVNGVNGVAITTLMNICFLYYRPLIKGKHRPPMYFLRKEYMEPLIHISFVCILWHTSSKRVISVVTFACHIFSSEVNPRSLFCVFSLYVRFPLKSNLGTLVQTLPIYSVLFARIELASDSDPFIYYIHLSYPWCGLKRIKVFKSIDYNHRLM